MVAIDGCDRVAPLAMVARVMYRMAMRVTLVCHPDTPCRTVSDIDVVMLRRGAVLELQYRAVLIGTGPIVPPPARPVRTDGLWQHTCFEAFVHADDGGYYECNFSPSTAWAAYRFAGYRAGQVAAAITPRLHVERNGVLALNATLTLPEDATGPIALSAVIEDSDGLSYWAVAHPPGRPDFHHADCFVAHLPPSADA